MSHLKEFLQMTRTWTNGITLLATVGIVVLTSACVSEEEVEDEMSAANYCENVDECVEIFPGCPLGCWEFVNAAEEERIRDLIDKYFDQQSGETCLYDCAGHGEVACTDGRCVADPE